MKTSKKILSVLLSLVMLLCVMPLAVIPASAYKVGDIINFGNYPQTKVSETSALRNAANAATWNSYKYYIGTGSIDGSMYTNDYMQYADFFSGGYKYRAVKFTLYRPQSTYQTSSAANSQQDDNGYFTNTTYYFRYEPLEWRVLDPSTGLVLCEKVIDAQAFNNVVRSDSGEYYVGVTTNYANNYALTTIRPWVNGAFYLAAFNNVQKGKLINKSISTICSYSVYRPQYNAGTTTNRLHLLSYQDLGNSSYGMDFYPGTRRALGTDYAKCQGLAVNSNGYASWWLRSAFTPGASNNVSSDGDYKDPDRGMYTYSVSGVRPACFLSDLTTDIAVKNVYTVSVSASPAAGGTVNVGNSGKFEEGATATVTATKKSGYTFEGWYQGDTLKSTSASYSFQVSEDIALTAKFKSVPQTVTVTAMAAGGGTLEGRKTVTITVAPGEFIELIATPDEGYTFDGWYSGDKLVCSTPVYDLNPETDLTLTAQFKYGYQRVMLFASPVEGGTVAGDGDYPVGDSVNVVATANEGWHFVGWYNRDIYLVSTEAAYSFPMEGSVRLTARFEQDTDPGTDPGNTDPDPQPENLCKWCGKVHEGFFQGIIGFFHRIFAAIFGAKY